MSDVLKKDVRETYFKHLVEVQIYNSTFQIQFKFKVDFKGIAFSRIRADRSLTNAK